LKQTEAPPHTNMHHSEVPNCFNTDSILRYIPKGAKLVRTQSYGSDDGSSSDSTVTPTASPDWDEPVFQMDPESPQTSKPCTLLDCGHANLAANSPRRPAQDLSSDMSRMSISNNVFSSLYPKSRQEDPKAGMCRACELFLIF
jgi:hypothetical protein